MSTTWLRSRHVSPNCTGVRGSGNTTCVVDASVGSGALMGVSLVMVCGETVIEEWRGLLQKRGIASALNLQLSIWGWCG